MSPWLLIRVPLTARCLWPLTASGRNCLGYICEEVVCDLGLVGGFPGYTSSSTINE